MVNHSTQSRELIAQLNLIINKPRLPFWTRNKETLAELDGFCKSYHEFRVMEEGSKMEFQLDYYSGSNKNVLALIQELERAGSQFIECVILQGSLATNEEVGYSDLDAMVVLNSRSFQSSKSLMSVIEELWKLYRNVAKQDILQHHGWFVTTQELLSTHFDDFFPAQIFKKSCFLYSVSEEESVKLRLVQDNQLYRKAFMQTALQTIKELETGTYVSNMYNLKSCLSKFMLLPSLYYQCTRSKGVYKADSFQLVKSDFTEKEWEVMDFASELRQNWRQPQSYWLRFTAILFPSVSRKLVKRFASRVRPDLKSALEAKRFEMLTFVKRSIQKSEYNKV